MTESFKEFAPNGLDSPIERRKDRQKRNAVNVKRHWTGALNKNQLIDLISTARKSPRKGLQHALIIQLSATTGLRRSEEINLQLKDLNFAMNSVTVSYKEEDGISKTAKWTAKTYSSYRTVMVDQGTLGKISAYLEQWGINDQHDYVFPPYRESDNKKRFTPNSFTNMINTYARNTKSIGQNIGHHALRRTYGSLLLDLGIPMTHIQRLYGHRNLRTTLLYLKDVYTPSMELRIRDAVSHIVDNNDENELTDEELNDPETIALMEKTMAKMRDQNPLLFG